MRSPPPLPSRPRGGGSIAFLPEKNRNESQPPRHSPEQSTLRHSLGDQGQPEVGPHQRHMVSYHEARPRGERCVRETPLPSPVSEMLGVTPACHQSCSSGEAGSKASSCPRLSVRCGHVSQKLMLRVLVLPEGPDEDRGGRNSGDEEGKGTGPPVSCSPGHGSWLKGLFLFLSAWFLSSEAKS